jgi:hypothetical protein
VRPRKQVTATRSLSGMCHHRITRENYLQCEAKTDHIRASGHNGCIQRPDTWLHPNDSRKRQILFPCTAGAVHTWHEAGGYCGAASRPLLKMLRTRDAPYHDFKCKSVVGGRHSVVARFGPRLLGCQNIDLLLRSASGNARAGRLRVPAPHSH